MTRQKFRLGWVVAVLALATLACTCGFMQGLTEAGQSLQTVQALGTQAVTLQAMATELATSGALETLQSAVTQAATSGALETAQALGNTLGDVPEDIPVMENAQNLFAVEGLVTYTTKDDFKTVLDFYKNEMIANGWTEAEGSTEFGDTAVLNYEKTDQKANVTITGTGPTTVAITISSQ